MESIAVNLGRQDDLTENLIGAEVYLSLKPFIRYIEGKVRSDKSTKSNIYRYILTQFSRYPELNSPIPPSESGKYKELFELIYICLSPLLNDQEQQLWALGTPLTPHFYFGTPAFYEIILDPITQELRVGLNLTGPQEMEQSLKIGFYNLVLKKFYNFSLTDKAFTIYSIVDQETHLLKYYRLNIDRRFIDIYNHGSLPELRLQSLKSSGKDEATILAYLGRILPTKQFSIEGIAIVNLEEVTVEYALESIKNVIIEHNACSAGNYHSQVIKALKTICGSEKLEFGLLPYLRLNNRTLVNDQSGFESIVLNLAKSTPQGNYQKLLADYLAAPRKLVFQEIPVKEQEKFPMLKLLFQTGIRSYGLFPLHYNGKLVGCLEVYSKTTNTLDANTVSKLELTFSLLAQLYQNIITEFNYELTRVITDKFTSIQPAVQWRFYEAAYEYLTTKTADQPAKAASILFKDVQPFYGAIDIKDSSIQRNMAIRKDLNLHFELLGNTMKAIESVLENPIQDYIPSDALISNYREHKQLSDQEILKIEDYLLRQLPPYLRLLEEGKPALSEIIGNYFKITGGEGIVYANRRQYEKSMQTVNGKINGMLHDFNSALQAIYPCYFEKFRTDGVEFDIYVGQSIAPDKPMPDNLIKTFRLLHLETIANIARATQALIPDLSDYLQTTQLIFVHERCIDICFRSDEQRFDVEGGYNIRYQLVKKRIDKAHIKHSEERLTQPGKIAIVYMNNLEAQEYIGYIKVLQSRNILTADVEHFEIEELQGVDGLKALRVGIVY
jgi:hypothetical protein